MVSTVYLTLSDQQKEALVQEATSFSRDDNNERVATLLHSILFPVKKEHAPHLAVFRNMPSNPYIIPQILETLDLYPLHNNVNIFTPDETTRYAENSGFSAEARIGYHIEEYAQSPPPSHQLIACEIGNEDAVTGIIFLKDILPHLDEETLAQLCKPEYYTFANNTRRPVLKQDNDQYSLFCFSGGTKSDSAEAEAAQQKLRAVVEKVGPSERLILQAGDWAIIDNQQAMHDRGPFHLRADKAKRRTVYSCGMDRTSRETGISM